MATTYINGIKYGSTTITASYTDGGVTKTSSVTFTVNRTTASLVFDAVGSTLTYNGSSQKIGTISYTGDGAVYYYVKTTNSAPAANDSGWIKITSWSTTNGDSKTFNVNQTNAATYYVFLKADTGTNYNSVSVKSGNSSQAIGKATVNVTTAPTYVTGTLTYNGTTNSNGTAQTLVTAGSCSTGGQFYYYVSTSSTAPSWNNGSGWSTTLPTGTNAGNYYVWYYCNIADTSNYQAGTNAGAVKALANSPKNIGRAKTASASAANKTYNGTTETNGTSQTGVTGSHVTWSGTTSATNAGSYSASATPESNFAWSDGTYAAKSISWTMSRRGQTAPVLQGATTTYPTAASATVKTAGTVADGTATAPGTLTWTNQTRSTAGSQTATAYYAATTTNFSASPTSAGVTVAVNQRTVTVTAPTFVSSTLTYNGSNQTVASGGTCTTGGTMYYYISTSSTAPTVTEGSAPGTGWTTSSANPQVVQAKNAGTYYVWYYCYVSDTTNNKSNTASGQKAINTVYQISGTKEIGKKEVSLSWSTHSWVYDGTQKTVTCTAGSLASGDSCTVTVSNNTRTNQGSQTVTATALSNNNYKLPSTATTTLSISKRPIKVTAASDSKVFNNTALTNSNATAEATGTDRGLVNGHTMTSCTVTGSQTTVGNSSNVPSGAVIKSGSTTVTDNYDIEYVNGTLTVTKATLTVTEVNYNAAYDGSSHASTIKVTSAGWDGKNIVKGSSTSYGTSVTTNGTVNTVYTLYSATNYTAQQTVYYKITGGTNFEDYTDSVTFKITSATGNVGSASNPDAQTYKRDATYSYQLGMSGNTGAVTYSTSITVKNSSNSSVSGWTCTSAGVVTVPSNTPAGTYTVTGSVTCAASSNNNYAAVTTGQSRTWTITISKGTLTVSEVNYSGAFNNASHSSTVTVTSAGWDGKTIVYGSSTSYGSTATNNGVVNTAYALKTATNYTASTTVYYKVSGGNNYEDYADSVTFQISKANLSVTEVNYTGTYDGSNHSSTVKVTSAGWDGATIKTGTTSGTYGTTVTSSGVTGTAYALKTASVYTASTTVYYQITGGTNFNDYTDSVTFEIKKAGNANVSVTINSDTLVYNGSAQTLATATATGTSSASIGYRLNSAATADSQITWVSVGTALTATNAGTYYIYRKWTADSNHSNNQTFVLVDTNEIELRPIKITASSASRDYNGSALTSNSATPEAAGTNRGLVSGQSMTSVTVTGSQTYVGSSSNVPSAAVIKSGSTDVTSNYDIEYVNGTLTISKATPSVTVTGVTKDYTGGSFYATANVNAKGTLYWKRGSAPTTSSNDGSVSITAINTNTNITSVKDNSDDFVLYWLFVPSSTANSLSSGHTYAENFTNAGGGSSDKVNLTINPRSITNATASATAVTYNGSQQTASVSITDAGGNLTSSDYTISGNTGTNATNYTITITGKNNYTGTKTITWTINKRAVTITAGSASKTYDGTALTKNTVTASTASGNTGIVASHHVHTWTVSGSQTIAGSSDNVVSVATIYDGTHSGTEGDVTSNYTITYAKGTLTVNPAAITYTATNQTKVYDGTKLTAANTASRTAGLSSLPSGHSVTFTCTGEIGPNVSTGVKTLSTVVIKNSGGTDVTSSFTVTKNNGTLSITIANGSISYSANNTPASKPCTSQAKTASATDYNIPITIATSSASTSTNTGASITYSVIPSTLGITVASDGKTLTVASGTNASATGYNVTVRATVAATTNYTSAYADQSVNVKIDPVALSRIELVLAATSVAYGSSTSVSRLTAYYTNSASKPITDSIGVESNSNPRVYASDTTIATVTK